MKRVPEDFEDEYGMNIQSMGKLYDFSLVVGIILLFPGIKLSELKILYKKITRKIMDIKVVNSIFHQLKGSDKISIEIAGNHISAVFHQNPKTEITYLLFQNQDWIKQVHGYLRGKHHVNLRRLEEMSGLSQYQLIEIMALLSISGFAKLSIDELGNVFVGDIITFEAEVMPTYEQRIFLGYLKSENNPKINKIANLFQIPQLELEREFNAFVSEDIIRGELTRSGSVIMDDIKPLPVTRQVQELLTVEAGVLGHLLSSERINSSELELFWEISKRELHMLVYDLVGSAFITCKSSSGVFSQVMDLRDPDTHLFGHNEFVYKKLCTMINGPSNIEMIANEIDQEVSETIAHLYEMIGYAVYPYGKIEDNIFKPNGNAFELPKLHCKSCNNELDIGSKRCMNCGSFQDQCLICRSQISLYYDIMQCPFCHQQYHKGHILNWIQFKGICPKCRKELSKNKLQEEYI